MTGSWVYLFSKFTPEAILFELLGIFVLTATYSAYWIIKKRKVGAADEEAIPGDVVKIYLNELILDAENMRAQLFGLLQSQGAHADGAGAAASGPADPKLLIQIKTLEAKMAEQAAAMEQVSLERTRIAGELEAAKAAGGAAGAVAAGAGVDTSELTAKIANLEGKLAEYSIIEDDLANLKRLQQENAQLKAQIAAAPSGASAAAPAGAAPQVAAAVAAAPAPAAEPIPAAPPAQFEELVDQVEKSLQPDPAPAPPAEVAAATAAAPPVAAAAAPATPEKSDADLVQEFEKMLNG